MTRIAVGEAVTTLPVRRLRLAAVLAWAGVLALGLVYVVSQPAPATPTVFVLPASDPLVLTVEVGGSRSVMGQRTMRQAPHTSGPSADRLAFAFDKPVLITGILISVDIAGPQLVEFAIGIDPEGPYGLAEEGTAGHREFAARDWLLHVSDSNDGPSKIDEHIWFADPFRLDPGEVVAVDAWLGNPYDYPVGVSPEVIVFYELTGG